MIKRTTTSLIYLQDVDEMSGEDMVVFDDVEGLDEFLRSAGLLVREEYFDEEILGFWNDDVKWSYDRVELPDGVFEGKIFVVSEHGDEREYLGFTIGFLHYYST